MISRQQTQHKQAIALMLGWVVSAKSGPVCPSLTITTINYERGNKDTNRVLGASM